MKNLCNEIARAAVMGFILPAALLLSAAGLRPEQPKTAQETQPSRQEPSEPVPETQDTASVPAAPVQPMEPIRIWVLAGDVLQEMELETYLLGVMLAEVPASFQMEALRAQAVASRTYTLRCTASNTHGIGAVCTQSACCQAYISPDAYISRGGLRADVEKMQHALSTTAGQVLTYEGKLILATYFSCSGGSTEDASAVWGRDYPYLQAVESPGEEIAFYYTDTFCFPAQAFKAALGEALTGPPESWFGPASYTDGGGIREMEIGSKTYTGVQLRQLLGLRSTAFTVQVESDVIYIYTRGFGHRVGMSQYGAEAMALCGNTYGQILSHYYSGTTIAQYAVKK